ncbi:Chalcone synthase 1, partial [Linum perenne]
KLTNGEGLEWGVLFGFGPGLTVETVVLHSLSTVATKQQSVNNNNGNGVSTASLAGRGTEEIDDPRRRCWKLVNCKTPFPKSLIPAYSPF